MVDLTPKVEVLMHKDDLVRLHLIAVAVVVDDDRFLVPDRGLNLFEDDAVLFVGLQGFAFEGIEVVCLFDLGLKYPPVTLVKVEVLKEIAFVSDIEGLHH